MTINEAKTKLKEKGYSIRTIYDPKQSKIEVHILKKNAVVEQFRAYETNLEEYFNVIKK